MQERYRTDYDGEFVILNTRYEDGKKIQDKEWIPNPIENQYISARAAVVGHGVSREKFNIKNIQDHRGGLLGRKRLQVYGSQGCWQELRCDFYVENDAEQLEQIIETGYAESSTVYTGVKNCIAFPGEFYLIPYNLKLNPVATAMYIAAFDGHKEIYLLGVDSIVDDVFNQKEAADILKVINTYRTSTFYFISDMNVEPCFRSCQNVKTMGYREFISHCDV